VALIDKVGGEPRLHGSEGNARGARNRPYHYPQRRPMSSNFTTWRAFAGRFLIALVVGSMLMAGV